MIIKKGDKVKVITGASKGVSAEVLRAFPKKDLIIVEGVNMVKKHLKPSQVNPDGGVIEKEAAIHASNVVLDTTKAKKTKKDEKKPAKKVAKKPVAKTAKKVKE